MHMRRLVTDKGWKCCADRDMLSVSKEFLAICLSNDLVDSVRYLDYVHQLHFNDKGIVHVIENWEAALR
jgi:hypothetical protein